MIIAGTQYDLLYPFRINPGLSIFKQETAGGYLYSRDLGIAYDHVSSKFKLGGTEDQVQALRVLLDNSITSDTAISATLAEGEHVFGPHYQAGVFAFKCVSVGDIQPAGYKYYSIELEVEATNLTSMVNTSADLTQIIIPNDYVNDALREFSFFRAQNAIGNRTVAQSYRQGSFVFSGQTVDLERAGAVAKDIVLNIRSNSFLVPADWDSVKLFGAEYQATQYAFVNQVNISVRSKDENIFYLELIKDVK